MRPVIVGGHTPQVQPFLIRGLATVEHAHIGDIIGNTADDQQRPGWRERGEDHHLGLQPCGRIVFYEGFHPPCEGEAPSRGDDLGVGGACEPWVVLERAVPVDAPLERLAVTHIECPLTRAAVNPLKCLEEISPRYFRVL